MREEKSDRGGLDGAVGRSMDSDGHNVEGTKARLGRKYSGKAEGRGKGARRAKAGSRKNR